MDSENYSEADLPTQKRRSAHKDVRLYRLNTTEKDKQIVNKNIQEVINQTQKQRTVLRSINSEKKDFAKPLGMASNFLGSTYDESRYQNADFVCDKGWKLKKYNQKAHSES